MAFFANFPTIAGLGQFGGFDFWLEDRKGAGRPALYGAMGALLGKTAQQPEHRQRAAERAAAGAAAQAQARPHAGASRWASTITDVYSAVQLMLAPVYVNDFLFEGRVLRVTMQADAPFRMNEESLQRFYLPAGTTADTNRFSFAGDNASDGMVPLSSVLRSTWTVAPPSQARFNGFPAVNINGGPAPGKSSGEAMKEMERIVRRGSAAGLRLRLGGPVVPGTALRRRGADVVRVVDPRGVPVPRGAVRELGDAHRGVAGGARGHHRFGVRGA